MLSRRNPVGFIFIAVFICSVLIGCSGSGRADSKTGPVIVRIAHNYPREMDTNFRDSATGRPHMSPEELTARIYAEEQVLNKFNVKFQWIQYPGDLNEDILRSVLAGDPLAEL